MHIHHVAIWTNDLEKEKEFYLKYFDCHANEKYTNPLTHFSSYFLSFSSGAKIELMTKDGITPTGEGKIDGFAHLAIDAGSRQSVEEITDLLEKDGIRIASRPRLTGDGYYESTVLDPEGNMIEIISVKS